MAQLGCKDLFLQDLRWVQTVLTCSPEGLGSRGGAVLPEPGGASRRKGTGSQTPFPPLGRLDYFLRVNGGFQNHSQVSRMSPPDRICWHTSLTGGGVGLGAARAGKTEGTRTRLSEVLPVVGAPSASVLL